MGLPLHNDAEDNRLIGTDCLIHWSIKGQKGAVNLIHEQYERRLFFLFSASIQRAKQHFLRVQRLHVAHCFKILHAILFSLKIASIRDRMACSTSSRLARQCRVLWPSRSNHPVIYFSHHAFFALAQLAAPVLWPQAILMRRSCRPHTFPNIDPIIFEIGPFALRWYALAYMAGLILGWKYMVALTKRHKPVAARCAGQ